MGDRRSLFVNDEQRLPIKLVIDDSLTILSHRVEGVGTQFVSHADTEDQLFRTKQAQIGFPRRPGKDEKAVLGTVASIRVLVDARAGVGFLQVGAVALEASATCVSG